MPKPTRVPRPAPANSCYLIEPATFPSLLGTSREAVALRKQVRGSGQAGLAISMKALAMVLWRQGQFAEVETLARDALAIERAALGGEHLAVADSLKILGTVLNSKNDLAGAED